MTGIGIIITAAVALIIGGVAGYAIFRYVIKGKYNEMIDAANKEAEVIKEKKLLEVKEKFLNKSGTESVTAEDIALLAASEEAGRKGCPEHAAYTVVLNKADNAGRRETAINICRKLKNKGLCRVLVTSYPDSRKKNNR